MSKKTPLDFTKEMTAFAKSHGIAFDPKQKDPKADIGSPKSMWSPFQYNNRISLPHDALPSSVNEFHLRCAMFRADKQSYGFFTVHALKLNRDDPNSKSPLTEWYICHGRDFRKPSKDNPDNCYICTNDLTSAKADLKMSVFTFWPLSIIPKGADSIDKQKRKEVLKIITKKQPTIRVMFCNQNGKHKLVNFERKRGEHLLKTSKDPKHSLESLSRLLFRPDIEAAVNLVYKFSEKESSNKYRVFTQAGAVVDTSEEVTHNYKLDPDYQTTSRHVRRSMLWTDAKALEKHLKYCQKHNKFYEGK